MNTVKKILCVVTGYEAEAYVNEIDDMDLDGGNNRVQQVGRQHETSFRALYTQQTAM